MMITVEAINSCLPQTQCTRCGYPCCEDYASAIAASETTINRCPPGDQVTITALAELTEQAAMPLEPEVGTYQPKTLAFIDEAICIGCVLCIKACPVDAIIGANKQMHTVIAEHCTGCELCLPVCPTDCIDMLPLNGKQIKQAALQPSAWPGYSQRDIEDSKRRFDQHTARRSRIAATKKPKQADGQADNKVDAIMAAVQRRKAQLKQNS